MAVLQEGARIGDVVVLEFSDRYNRETVTVVSGEGVLDVGAVLGRVTASGKFAHAPAASVVGKEGAETAAAVLLEKVDASAADAKAVVLKRGPAVVNRANLVFAASVDLAAEQQAKVDDLEAIGIVARSGA